MFLFPFWKGVYSVRKEFAPKGSEFFPYRVDPYSEVAYCALKQIWSHKNLFSSTNVSCPFKAGALQS